MKRLSYKKGLYFQDLKNFLQYIRKNSDKLQFIRFLLSSLVNPKVNIKIKNYLFCFLVKLKRWIIITQFILLIFHLKKYMVPIEKLSAEVKLK